MVVAFCLLLCFANLYSRVNGNDFSSFLTANASLAIVVDEEYMEKKQLNIISQIKKAIEDISRENLKNGGLNVRYFTWSTVRLKKDFIAAITVTDCKKTWQFFDMAETNSILLLAVTEAECPRLPDDKALMIPLVESGSELPQLLLDIRAQKILRWDSSVIVFDSSIDERSTQILTSLVRENSKNKLKPISIYVYQLSDDSKNKKRLPSIENTLIKFKHIKYNRFIVLLSNIEDVMETAKKLNMLNVYNQWMFFLPNDINQSQVFSLAANITEGANVVFAVNSTKKACEDSILCTVMEIASGFISALSYVIVEEGALYGQISDEEWEAIRLTKEERQIEILMYIKSYLAKRSKCSGCSQWSFKSVLTWGSNYHENPSNLNKVIDSGDWSPLFGFVSKDILFPNFEHKFRNASLNVITYNNPPWQIIVKDEQGNIIQKSGIVIEILKEIGSKLNFSFILEDFGKNTMSLSKVDKNMELSGPLTNSVNSKFMENISAKKYFLVAVGTTINNINEINFNYTVPISIQAYSFLTKKPDEVSRMYLFAAPFTTQTWICLFAIIIITAPILCLINKYGSSDELKTPGLCKLRNCYWYIYGALLQQGGLYLPKADSGRVIVGVWWTVVIVLVTTYCGNLVAFLTFPKFQQGITHLSQIYDNKDIHSFGLRNGTFFEKYAKTSTRKDFHDFVKKATFYTDLEEKDISEVQEGRRINVDWRIHLQLTIQNDFDQNQKCSLVLGQENFVDEQIGMIVPQSSPYLNLINEEIILLQQMGFVDRWHKKYLPSIDKCNTKTLSRQISNHKVDMEDMQGCFLVLLLGFLAAVVFIFGEFGINYWIKRKTKTYLN